MNMITQGDILFIGSMFIGAGIFSICSAFLVK